MSSATPLPLPNLRVAVACGADLCDTAEGLNFLRQRQALFGKLCFLVSGGLYLLINLVYTANGLSTLSRWITDPFNVLHLGGTLAFGVVWKICRRPRLGRAALGWIDATSSLLIGIIVGTIYALIEPPNVTDYPGIAALAVILFVRSFAIPSSPVQTLVNCILAGVPAIVGYGFLAWSTADALLGDPSLLPGDSLAASPLARTAVFSFWCVAIGVVCTVASWVTYGLQQEVRDARELGQYTLEERIGRGGMGEVYRASHTMLRRPTAVKVLRPENTGEQALARFEREVQLTSQLTHPNTIAIYDYGRTPEGTFYYAMEFLEGCNLEDLVEADGPQPPARVIHILRQICASLAEAHEAGLIHRDVKPANVVLSLRGGLPDVVKVLDFGLVKSVASTGGASVSGANTITGSPRYLSPEAIRSPDKVDGRSDLYAVGAIGYFLLTGSPVFESENVVELCSLHLHAPVQPPGERLGRAVPADLERLILSCLEKTPDARPENARVMRDLLSKCVDHGRWSDVEAAAWWSAWESDRDRRRAKDNEPVDEDAWESQSGRARDRSTSKAVSSALPSSASSLDETLAEPSGGEVS